MNQPEIPLAKSLQYETNVDLGQFREKVWHSVMLACGIIALPRPISISVYFINNFDGISGSVLAGYFPFTMMIVESLVCILFCITCFVVAGRGPATKVFVLTAAIIWMVCLVVLGLANQFSSNLGMRSFADMLHRVQMLLSCLAAMGPAIMALLIARRGFLS